MPDPRDFSSRYNTQLTPQELGQYTDWAKKQTGAVGRDILKDSYDYDMQGWWKNNPNVDLKDGHLTDQFKKPNHPTFSDQSQYHGVDDHEGGMWAKMPNGSWSFVPGKTNMYKPEEMQDYFGRVEKGNSLARQAPDGNWYIENPEGGFLRIDR